MLSIESGADGPRRERVHRRLRETNSRRSPVLRALRGTDAEREIPVELYAFDSEAGEEPVAGLVGHVWGDWLHIDLLWVDEGRRGGGLGKRLMAEAERVAREEHRCVAARVQTWDFQAPGFYQGLDYEIVASVPDYPPGCTDHLLTKRL